MQNAIFIAQVTVSILLSLGILVQVKGTGFGRVWGSSWNSSFSRRGIERFVFRATFFLAAAFILVSGLALII